MSCYQAQLRNAVFPDFTLCRVHSTLFRHKPKHIDPDFAFIDTYLAMLALLDEVLSLNIGYMYKNYILFTLKLTNRKVWKIAVGYESGSETPPKNFLKIVHMGIKTYSYCLETVLWIRKYFFWIRFTDMDP